MNKVDIVCITYNHKNYIQKCLDGFLKQNTTFSYRILVYDDASTDGTQEILNRYFKDFPKKFLPLLQTENQFSKSAFINMYINSFLDSEYVAICEGDDYWCDDLKLQKQVDFLDKNPEYVACAHNTIRLNAKTNKRTLMYSSDEDYDVSLEDVLHGGNAAFHTSSILFRRKYFLVPEEFMMGKIGDFPREIYLSLNGKIRFIKGAMSVYRIYSSNSWTSKQNVETLTKCYLDIISGLRRIDEYTQYRSHLLFEMSIKYQKYYIEFHSFNYKALKRNYWDLFNKEKRVTRLKIFMISKFPFLYSLYKKVKYGSRQ